MKKPIAEFVWRVTATRAWREHASLCLPQLGRAGALHILCAGLLLLLLTGCRGDSPESGGVESKQLFPVRHLDLVGLINEQGQEVVSPRFQLIGDWSDGLMPAMREDKWGFIDAKANFWIAPQFDNAAPFSEDLAAVVVHPAGDDVGADGERIYNWGSLAERKAGYIDRNGKMVILPRFTGVSRFSEGLAAVREGSMWGFIDATGAWVIEPRYGSAKSFAEGLAAVQVDGQWGYVDPTGLVQVPPRFFDAYSFSDGRAAVRDLEDGPWHFIDPSGEPAFAGQFHWAGRFAVGVAPVKVGPDWGYVDLEGTLVIAPQFDRAEPFSEGRAAVKVRGLGWGFIDERGTIVIEPTFERVEAFSGGLALIETRHATYGYVDVDGRMVWEPTN